MESSCHQSLGVILRGEGESYHTQHTGWQHTGASMKEVALMIGGPGGFTVGQQVLGSCKGATQKASS